jgi:hypothetical protein
MQDSLKGALQRAGSVAQSAATGNAQRLLRLEDASRVMRVLRLVIAATQSRHVAHAQFVPYLSARYSLWASIRSNHTDGLVEGEAIALTASRRTSLSAHAFVLQASGVIGHNGQDAYQELDVKGRVMAHVAKSIPPSTVHFQSPRCVLQVSHSRSLPVPGARTATSCAKRAHGTPQQVRQLF